MTIWERLCWEQKSKTNPINRINSFKDRWRKSHIYMLMLMLIHIVVLIAFVCLFEVGQGASPPGSPLVSVFALFPIGSSERDGNGTASHVLVHLTLMWKPFHRKRKLIRHEHGVLLATREHFAVFPIYVCHHRFVCMNSSWLIKIYGPMAATADIYGKYKKKTENLIAFSLVVHEIFTKLFDGDEHFLQFINT